MRGVSLLVLLACGSPVLAYSAAPPQSYTKTIPGAKFVLVMINSHESKERPSAVAKQFDKSGLYSVNDLKNPLWTCDWCAEYERNVTVSRDGEWAVRVPDVELGLRHWLLGSEGQRQYPLQPGWQDRPAVWVYRKGQLVHTLAVKDLFDTSRFTGNDCFMGPIITLDPIDDTTGRVRVNTAHADGSRQTATVDAKTGEVIDRDNGLGLGFEDCGNNGPSDGWNRWVWVGLIGMGVVGVGAGAVVGLTVLLVRGQAKPK